MTEQTFWRRLGAGWAARRPPIVSVLRLDGVIGGGGRFQRGLTLDALADEIDAAFAGRRVRAVALAINSPGGAPVQAELIRQRLVSLSREKEVPIYAFCEDVAPPAVTGWPARHRKSTPRTPRWWGRLG